MNRDQIETARNEAQRFLDKCDDAYNALKWRPFNNGSGGYWDNTDTKATAAVKRSSMDLSRALADLRRPS